MTDYFRPRGDITTVLDLTNRDAQDNTYFPVDAEASWFHRDSNTIYPTTTSIQEATQRGPASWGQTFSFEIGSLPAGDMLQSVMLQLHLGSWYKGDILAALTNGSITTDLTGHAADYWTFINRMGASIIESADFIVGDQTIERITGEFIASYLTLYSDQNSLVGITNDAVGSVPYSLLSSRVSAGNPVLQTPFHPARPFPTEDGTYFCLLPFFFFRTPLEQAFPLLACHEGQVRIDVTLRPFEQMARSYLGYRANAMDTPLGKTVTFVNTTTGLPQTTTTLSQCPDFRDARLVTTCSLLSGSLRSKMLRQPFEQMVKLVQPFSFEEPLKYLVSKGGSSDQVTIQLPLELNHPVSELVWVFRRKAVRVNNEWANFTPSIGLESTPDRFVPAWLVSASLRIQGSEVISAEGDWFREHIAKTHRGGWNAYASSMYGYSFSASPESHQPSGSANMSRATSIQLQLTVRTPFATDLATLSPPCVFDPAVVGGWEVFVFAIHYQWIRFDRGICQRMFTD
jgi:hypothetical protein